LGRAAKTLLILALYASGLVPSVWALGPGSPDLALGQPTFESDSTSNPWGVLASSALAVDGNTDGNFYDKSVTENGTADSNAYWYVDLQARYNISSIVIWGRTDCCQDRLDGATVSVFPAGQDPNGSTGAVWSGQIGTVPTPPGNSQVVGSFSPAVAARYVKVQLNPSSVGYLSLAEVQVYGTAAVPSPAISSLNPASAPVNASAVNLTINGSNFVSGATAKWTENGQTTALSTQFQSSTKLTAAIPGNLLTSAGTAQVTVANPTGSPSAPSAFTVTAATVTTINAVTAILPQANQTITVSGAGFGTLAPFTGTSNYLRITDLTGQWNAGYGNNLVTISVTSWTGSQIVIQGFQGSYGQNGWSLHAGDQVEVQVWNPQTGSTATFQLTVSQNPGGSGTAPTIASVTSGVSYQPGAPIGVGAPVAVCANGLPASPFNAGAPLPTSLGGVQVLLEGTAIPIIRVQSGCVLAQVPWGIASDQGSFQVVVNSVSSAAVIARISRYAPAVFKLVEDDSPQAAPGAVYHANADGTPGAAVTASAAAEPGEWLIAHVAGLGPPKNIPPDGSLIATAGASDVTIPVAVSVGGAAAPILFARQLAQTDAQIFQPAGTFFVGFDVPMGAPAGGSLPLQITAGGQTSNTVTIAVAAAGWYLRPHPELVSRAGQTSQPTRPTLTAISSTDVPAYSNLTLTGDFSNQPGVAFGVRFTDGGAYDITLPANNPDPQTLVAVVPHYTTGGQLSDGHVTVQAAAWFAGQMLLSDAALPLHIQDLPDNQDAPGSVVGGVLTSIKRALSEMQGAYLFSEQADGKSSYAAAKAVLEAYKAPIDNYISAIAPIASGQVQSVSLGTFNGQAVTRTAGDLSSADRILRASLSAVISVFTAPGSAASARVRGRPAPKGIVTVLQEGVPIVKDIYNTYNTLQSASNRLDQPIAPDEAQGCAGILSQLLGLSNQAQAINDACRAALGNDAQWQELNTSFWNLQNVINAQQSLLQDCYRNEVANQLENFTNSLDTSGGGSSSNGATVSSMVNPPPLGSGAPWLAGQTTASPAPGDSGPLADLVGSAQQAANELQSIQATLEGGLVTLGPDGYQFTPAPEVNSTAVTGNVEQSDGSNCVDCEVEMCVSGGCAGGTVTGSEPTYSDGSYSARIPSNINPANPVGISVLDGNGSPFAVAVINLGASNMLYVQGSQTSQSPFGTGGGGGGGGSGALVNRLTFTASATFSQAVNVACPGEFSASGLPLDGEVTGLTIGVTLPQTIASLATSNAYGINGTTSWSIPIAGCNSTSVLKSSGTITVSEGLDSTAGDTTVGMVFTSSSLSGEELTIFTGLSGWGIPLAAATFTGPAISANYLGVTATVTLQ
jgi:uncharacterized protein (TIGR03437 family)